MTTIRITKNQLINIAIESVSQRNNLSMFREYVDEARKSGLLKMSEEAVELLVKDHDRLIFGKGFDYQEQDKKLPDHTRVYGQDYWRDGRAIEGSALDGYMTKTKSILLLKIAIPNYMDIIQPRPARVYLIDDLKFWPLFKVVGVHRHGSQDFPQLYLVGKDRHTKQPFALGIPNGFIDMPFEACLRWTLDAHKGDVVIEV